MDFADKWAAIVWMCRNQLGRRNITDEQKTVLIGEAYKAQKMTQGGERGTTRDESGKFTASRQNGDMRECKRTKDIIAKQFGVGSYNAVSKIHGVSATTVKNIVLKSADCVEKCEQKKNRTPPQIG